MFKKILVANRGEIALRIQRACRELGIKAVMVYSEADRDAKYVKLADEAVCIGPAASGLSYLNMPALIAAAEVTDSEAIHPGYGFLSENANFADRVEQSGFQFIGPTGDSIRLMGDKVSAKQAMIKAGVPCVPGSEGELPEDPAAIKRIAKTIGYPVIIKAAGGGGGRGMRVVHTEAALINAVQMTKAEAGAAFNNPAVYMEKFLQNPRHIEIQLMADNYGNTCYLFERECSIQRRHQKLVEEAPSAVLTEEIRRAMGEAAVNVAKACNYSGAGTVEFLLSDNMEFYFLEMNTRLQVEHPVTELITGIDLVKEQIRVAAGETLSFSQGDLKIHGHAIELRICAEDPMNQFLPNVGRVETYKVPQGSGIRVDDCMESGMDIPIYYDNMLAKLIVWAPSRLEAIERMRRAISEYVITGIETTLMFGDFVMKHPAFIEGKFDTHFIQQYFTEEQMAPEPLEAAEAALLSAAALHFFQQSTAGNTNETAIEHSGSPESDWYRNRKNFA